MSHNGGLPGTSATQPAHPVGSPLILMSLPCVLPIPGIGNVMGVGLMALAWLIWRGEQPSDVSGRARPPTLNAHRRRQIRRWIRRLHRLAEPWCRPRLEGLVTLRPRSWRAATAALLVATMGVLIFLPIPLGNVLPAASVTCLGLGLSHRDGMAALWSAALAVLALAYPVALAAGAWTWGLAPLWRALGFGP
jgi:hypothetical protein